MQPHLQEVAGRAQNAKTVANSFLKLEDAPLTLGVMCPLARRRWAN